MANFKVWINRALHLIETMQIPNSEKAVFLTFDDGPEEGITEFVLEELEKHHAKATFFCTGENARKNLSLLIKIKEAGHRIGNHTNSHINGFISSTSEYTEDVEKADEVLRTNLFRPPWGSLKLSEFLILRRKYKIIYWNNVSNDTDPLFDIKKSFSRVKSKTKPGDVVLFHCSQKHECRTRQILPLYLDWLDNEGYKMLSIK